jgi:hypothetical protein
MSRLINNCKKGRHVYQNIYDTLAGLDVYEIIKWCKVCGSVEIDLEDEGVTFPGKIMPIQSPNIFEESK